MWATHYIEKLKNGQTVELRPRGNSMSGRIESGQLVTIAPIDKSIPRKGDIVLCSIGKRQYLHLVLAVLGDRYLICNNRGRINGWAGRDHIYGIVVRIE